MVGAVVNGHEAPKYILLWDSHTHIYTVTLLTCVLLDIFYVSLCGLDEPFRVRLTEHYGVAP